jgi:hypothetical protein
MSSKSPEDSPAAMRSEAIERATRDMELRGAVRREDWWLRINTTLLAMLFGIVAFFGRDLYSDVKTHTVELATLTERMNGIKEKVDKIAAETEENGRSLAEIKGFLQAMPHSSSKENSSESSHH